MDKFLVLVMIVLPYLDCMSGTFDLDTVDNWQVYNGDQLIFLGNATMTDGIEVNLHYKQVKDIKVVYRHCVQIRNNKVMLGLTVPGDKAPRWVKEFAGDFSGQYIIPFVDIAPWLKGKDSLDIWYKDKESPLPKKLGKILIKR